MYIYDEYDEYYRFPGGALRRGGSIRFRVLMKRGTVTTLRLLFSPDNFDNSEHLMVFKETRGAYDVFETEINVEKEGLYWYHFRADTTNGCIWIEKPCEHGESDKHFQLSVYAPEVTYPEWMLGSVIYHIFVDRFNKGSNRRQLREDAEIREDWGGQPRFRPDENGIVRNNDFFGGNLEGIIEKLDYLKKLGISCLYLSPIFEAASNHKYDTGDFMKVDPGFGDEDILKRLCTEAKTRGIRLILDGVFSHVGIDSRYFNRYSNYDSLGAWQSMESPYYKWFTFYEWNQIYEAWWGIQLLPSLNKNNETYREFITGKDGVVAKWMSLGISGWRLDVADEIPDVFLDPLCDAIRRENPEAYIVGEVWEDASNKISYGIRRRYLFGGQLCSVTNYPLKDAIIAFLRNRDAEVIASIMARLCQNYPKEALDLAMNVLGTHDTMRIITALGGHNLPENREDMSHYSLSGHEYEQGRRLLKLASLLQFTLPGIPCVYYGDEAGMQGGADPFNRGCYPWGAEDRELLEWYCTLSAVRKSCDAFRSGTYKLLLARESVFAFSRGDTAFIAVNMSERDFVLNLTDYGGGMEILPAGSGAIYTKTADNVPYRAAVTE